MSAPASGSVDTFMQVTRLFPPPAEFTAKARISSIEQYEKLWNDAKNDPEGFWGELGKELHWFKPFSKVLQWNEPFAKWFVGGQTNVSYNSLDIHLGKSSRTTTRSTSAICSTTRCRSPPTP